MRLRRHRRFATDIAATVVSVLDRHDIVITDLSAGGAMVSGIGYPVRSRCQIEYRGQTVYAIVMWSEEDRMGVHFPYDLNDGPLFDAMQAAHGARDAHDWHARPAVAAFGRRGTVV